MTGVFPMAMHCKKVYRHHRICSLCKQSFACMADPLHKPLYKYGLVACISVTMLHVSGKISTQHTVYVYPQDLARGVVHLV